MPDYEAIPPKKASKVSLRQKLNFFGLIRFITGYVRDSTGRPNNILMLFYGTAIVSGIALLGSVFYKGATYRVDVVCRVIPKTKTTKTATISKPKPKRRRRRASKRIRVKGGSVQRSSIHSACGGSPVTVHATLQPPAPLPTGFYWVIFGLNVFLGMLYMGRHKQTREWSVDLIYAWKGGSRRGGLEEEAKGASTTIEKVSSAVSLMSGRIDGKEPVDDGR